MIRLKKLRREKFSNKIKTNFHTGLLLHDKGSEDILRFKIKLKRLKKTSEATLMDFITVHNKKICMCHQQALCHTVVNIPYIFNDVVDTKRIGRITHTI